MKTAQAGKGQTMTRKEALSILKPAGNTEEDLKAAYRAACRQHHPDHGGNLEMMKLINLSNEFLQTHNWSTWEATNSQGAASVADEIMRQWDRVKTWPGIDGEICGTWIWVSGTAWRYKKQLKAAGFKWSSSKAAYYWHPAGYRKKSRRQFQMDDIRTMFGSQGLESDQSTAIA